MSYIVEIRTEVRDVTAAQAACRRLNLNTPTVGTARLFSGEVCGLIVNLPAWRYPVVFDTQSGQARFDNFEERWGARSELDRFLQTYAVEKATLEARKHGHTVTEQSLSDGSIKLTLNMGGAS